MYYQCSIDIFPPFSQIKIFGTRRLESGPHSQFWFLMAIRANLTYRVQWVRSFATLHTVGRVIESLNVVPPAAAEQCCNELLASISNYTYMRSLHVRVLCPLARKKRTENPAICVHCGCSLRSTSFRLQKTTFRYKTLHRRRVRWRCLRRVKKTMTMTMKKTAKKKDVDTEQRRRRRTMGKASI